MTWAGKESNSRKCRSPWRSCQVRTSDRGRGGYRVSPGIDKQPSVAVYHDPYETTSGFANECSSSDCTITKTQSGTPIWTAARPTPLERSTTRPIVVTRRDNSVPKSCTRAEGWVRRGSGRRTSSGSFTTRNVPGAGTRTTRLVLLPVLEERLMATDSSIL